MRLILHCWIVFPKSYLAFPREEIYVDVVYIHGQASVLHLTVCDDAPTQFLPPFAGLGLVHDRYLVFVPPPHDFVHGL